MKYFIANWKMNPVTEKEAIAIAQDIDEENVMIAPPFVFLKTLARRVKKASLAAQDVFWENPKGAYTGEISAGMIKSLGVSSVIIGHSERRRYGGDTDERVNRKTRAALSQNLSVIVCVGEPEVVRKKGMKSAERYVKAQLGKDLVGISKKNLNRVTIAYEPVWAIGTGMSAKPEEASSMMLRIKRYMKERYGVGIIKTIYGGSVTEKTIKGFMKEKTIEGFLVGGASLNPRSFKNLIQAEKRP